MEEGGGAGTGPALAEAIQAAEWEAAQHHAHVHVTRIPARYVKGCDGDMEEAARRWKETLAWCEGRAWDACLDSGHYRGIVN